MRKFCPFLIVWIIIETIIETIINDDTAGDSGGSLATTENREGKGLLCRQNQRGGGGSLRQFPKGNSVSGGGDSPLLLTPRLSTKIRHNLDLGT
jgi:hypothetical protein